MLVLRYNFFSSKNSKHATTPDDLTKKQKQNRARGTDNAWLGLQSKGLRVLIKQNFLDVSYLNAGPL